MKFASASSLSECAKVTVASSRMQVTPSRTLSASRTPGSAPCRAAACAHACPARRTHRGSKPPARPGPAVRDLLQRPPHRRHRRHQPEQFLLISHDPEIGDHPGAVRDRARQIRQHPAPVMHQQPWCRQRPRQAAGQAGPVSQVPQQRQPGMRHDSLAAAGDFQSRDHPVTFTPEVLPDLGSIRTFRRTAQPPHPDEKAGLGQRNFSPLLSPSVTVAWQLRSQGCKPGCSSLPVRPSSPRYAHPAWPATQRLRTLAAPLRSSLIRDLRDCPGRFRAGGRGPAAEEVDQ